MIRAATRRECEQFGELIGYDVSPGFRGIVLVTDETIYGFIGFDGWTPSSVTTHVWISPDAGLSTRSLIREAARYAFGQAGKKYIRTALPANEFGVIAFARRLGFTETTKVPNGWDDGVDLIHFHIHRDHPNVKRMIGDDSYEKRTSRT
ncbi:MAG: GNAT family N-acetyltransferase [Bacteroidia bacterium]|nr:GNAT family N-acetyltransferase [Bacteroidia bacterium]